MPHLIGQCQTCLTFTRYMAEGVNCEHCRGSKVKGVDPLSSLLNMLATINANIVALYRGGGR
jgi:hypothetical protein